MSTNKIILFFYLNANIILAQGNHINAVYLTAKDFKSHQTLVNNTKGEKYKVRLHNFLNFSFITIIINSTKYKYIKDSVFAYKTKANIYYRIYQNQEYEILNPNERILLYSKTSFTGYKFNSETKYFFSISAEEKIYPLSKYNLKLTTPHDSVFNQQLDIYFKSDEELLEFDSFYKIYKLNKLKKQLN